MNALLQVTVFVSAMAIDLRRIEVSRTRSVTLLHSGLILWSALLAVKSHRLLPLRQAFEHFFITRCRRERGGRLYRSIYTSILCSDLALEAGQVFRHGSLQRLVRTVLDWRPSHRAWTG